MNWSYTNKNQYVTPEDFLTDESFVEFINSRNHSSVLEWRTWLETNPQKQKLVNEAVSLYKSMVAKEELPTQQIEEAAYRFKVRMLTAKPANRLVGYKRVFVAIAAVVLIILSFTIFQSLNHSWPSLKTPYGEIKKNILSDGTEVVLNANSELKYKPFWKEGEDREVWLKGEGNFHVKTTASKSKFIVHADRFDVVVTGTVFNIVNRNEVANIVLHEGSVTVKTKSGTTWHMKPGDFVEYKDNTYTKKIVEAQKIAAWTEQKVIFDKTPLSEVAVLIKEHYGVDVEIEDRELQQQTVTGILPNNNLDVLLLALEATGEFSVKKDHDRISILSQKP